MKVKDLKNYLNSLDETFTNKEICFYDYLNNKAHNTPTKVYVVDESDEKYFDLVFNIMED